MRYADLLLPIFLGILGFAGWIARGLSQPSTAAQVNEDDDPDHNHGSRL